MRGLVINGFFIGIRLEGFGSSVVAGNYIGTNAAGTAAVSNSVAGVYVSSGGNTIGGAEPGAGNLISGNVVNGVFLSSADGVLVQGNYIGTDLTGTAAVPNGNEGVFVASGAAVIGGPAPEAFNLISGNRGGGVFLLSGGVVVQNNAIGTDISLAAPLGNGRHGIELNGPFAENNTIGGAGNWIAFNAGDGVRVDTGVGNPILSNAVFANGGLGIRLVNNGNQNQAAPVLMTAVASGGRLTLQGRLQSTPNTTFLLEFFLNTECDPTGLGEGEGLFGLAAVTTNPNGVIDFSQVFVLDVPPGFFVSAAATGPTFNTSAFSNCQAITGRQPPGAPNPGDSGRDLAQWADVAGVLRSGRRTTAPDAAGV